MQEYQDLANEISTSYFNSGSIPTETLTKIAQLKDLRPHQIEILAAEANKLIHTKKYASMKEKYFAADFPLADAKIAIQNLQLDSSEKIASSFIDPIFSEEGPDMFAMFGVEKPEMDKTAEVKHSLKHASEKAELISRQMKDAIIVKEAQLVSAQHSFIKMARQHMLEDSNSSARMKTLGFFDHFVKCAKIKQGKSLLAKLAYVMAQEGKLEPVQAKKAIEYFQKEADCKAPEELISQDLSAQVINGDHPLYITLKTVGDLEAEIERFGRNSGLVDDKVRILKQKIRAL
jgi:hypothetical protein